MSRKSLVTRGVFFAYGAILTQIFYSLASIPLALSFLSKAEFGMWSLMLALIGYLNMMELGMTNAFQRHLFESRDHKEDGRYGRMFVASVLSLGLASLLILVSGVGLTWIAAPIFRIPSELREVFFLAMSGKVVIASISLATRMAGAPLYVHQRHDLMQISQIVLYFILYLTLYLGLQAGWGLYALLASQAAGCLWGIVFNVFFCLRLKFYPPKGTLKVPTRGEWFSVLRYSRDLFVLQLGNQLATGMPTLLIPRLLGLEALAIWTVCTRPFKILKQLVSKPYQIALPMLCEIYIKGETQRMARRWSHVTQIVVGISVCALSVGAANNSTFIHLWVGENIAWDPHYDWLTALYFLVTILVFAVMGVAGFRKHFGSIRVTPYAEAALFIVNALWMTHLWGLTGLLLAAIVSQLPGRFWHGLKYLSTISGTPVSWYCKHAFVRPLLILPFTALAAWYCTFLTGFLPGYAGLLLSATCGTLLAGAIVIFFGVSADVRTELIQMLLKPLERWRAQRREQGDG